MCPLRKFVPANAHVMCVYVHIYVNVPNALSYMQSKQNCTWHLESVQ